ncbi:MULTISPECIES: tautomerase family protein [unclassified Streptomyces]|uniref:tautomerase family protein n=1 Tax=unclassified Streptomyces TaxID=2593676 RepID=UPI000DBA9E6A|nr:tautomerase family protein [Streptomyces sp. PsTaAH-130]MYU07564.1 tautomerase [Streptomyces sp. SID8366]MYU66166.1 tautomerase [Streptomyces sp. SID69]RAJ60272.1 4-oxalocrotonate tautomerase [Streptomyces sp. PsTaAH-130]
MPILSMTTWPNQTDEKCQELIEELTATVHRVIGAPLDKITVFIQEIPQNRWGEGGVLGTNPGFAELSRRRAAPADA